MNASNTSRRDLARRATLGLLLTAVIALTSGCASIRSGAHQDPAADLTTYRSFAWIDSDPLVVSAESTAAVSPLTRRKIMAALRASFEERGYDYRDDPAAADFVIAFTVGTREKIDRSSYPIVYRGDWDWHPYSGFYPHAGYEAHSYTEGTLGVDIFDARTRQPVWHGWASKRVRQADIDDPSPAIDIAAHAIAERFPPASQ